MFPTYGITTTWNGTGDWFANPTNWSAGVPNAGDDAVIASGAVLLSASTPMLGSVTMNGGRLTFTNWTTLLSATNIAIHSGAVMTHGAISTPSTNALGQWVPDARVYIACTNLTVETGGNINADYVGYSRTNGPGSGYSYDGTAHAGAGRRSFGSFSVKPAYNDPAAPDQPGSGGGPSGGANSTSGGGAIRIAAAGQLAIRGALTADGRDSAGTHGCGGSGGSIWLSCATFSGTTNGLISVNGGSGNYYGAPASAGRISLIYDTNAQAALPEPSPPIRFSGKPGAASSYTERLPAAMGSLYLPDARLLAGPFDGKRFQDIRLVIPGFTNWAPAALTLNDCILGLPAGLHLNVTGDLVLTNGAALHLFASPTNTTLHDYGAAAVIGGSLLIRSNAWLLPYADPTNGAVVKIAVSGQLAIANGGGINADDKGFDQQCGPGAGSGYSGGGYGGDGGAGFYDYGLEAHGRAYGSPSGPIQPGSGGGGAGAGRGGGVIRIAVAGDAFIDGLLSARGSSGLPNHQGGGAGGGIEIVCRTLHGAGSGLVRAEGGQGVYYGANGGGGRIVVRYVPDQQAAVTPRPQVRFSTYAYKWNDHVPAYVDPNEWAYWGWMGTLYLPDTLLMANSPTGAALLDAQRFWHTVLVISNAPATWSPASLTISNCVVGFPDGYRLNVGGDVLLDGGGTMPADMVGSNEARLVLRALPTNVLYGARLDIGGNLNIRSNGWIYPLSAGTNGPLAGQTNAVVGIQVTGNVNIEAAGGIDANGGGYVPKAGNGNGPGAGRNTGSGGGYGGQGGGTAGGYVYGTNGAPFEPGSPGGVFTLFNSGRGGGAIHLVADGNVTLDGTLSANGTPGAYYGGNGASGGSIFLCGRRVSGGGMLQARGGALGNQSVAGDGGGGRIAVWHRCYDPLKVESRIATRSVAGMIYTNVYPDLTLQVDAGGTNAQPGTKGFYEGEGPRLGSMIYMN
jgi:hypothetical protein